jgi:hypothetical protein
VTELVTRTSPATQAVVGPLHQDAAALFDRDPPRRVVVLGTPRLWVPKIRVAC